MHPKLDFIARRLPLFEPRIGVSQRRGVVLPNIDFLGVFVLGMVAIAGESLVPRLSGIAALQVLFGALLWLTVLLRFCRATYFSTPRLSGGDVSSMARRLSRKVYAVLYGEMLFDLALAGLNRAPSLPAHLETFQVYLAAGCVALVTIRVLAVISRLRIASAERPAQVARTR